MEIVEATEEHVTKWAALRAQLWPEESPDNHLLEMRDLFLSGNLDRIAFLALSDGGRAAGFAEASLRRDPVEGCSTSPVAYLEGIFVCEAERKGGVGKQLVDRVKDWGRAKNCIEFASDAVLDNIASQHFHSAIGFEETGRIVTFRMSL